MGEREINSGYLKVGASLELGYYDQHQVALDEALTVMDTLWQIVPMATRGYVLSWLARFGFRGDDVDKKVGILSGGEKSRLSLCVLIHKNPNLLVMDEPTNHLDIAMSDELLKSLQDYSGTIIFVSHDRYFIQQLATKFWVFHKALKGKEIYPTVSEPDLELNAAIDLAFSTPELKKTAPPPREKKKKLNPWFLEQKHKEIEQQLAALHLLEADLERVHRLMATSETYTDAARPLQLQEEMKSLQTSIAITKELLTNLETEYLELCYEG